MNRKKWGITSIAEKSVAQNEFRDIMFAEENQATFKRKKKHEEKIQNHKVAAAPVYSGVCLLRM